MTWKKVPAAAKEWAGGVNPKTLYHAIRTGKCKAARIGAGRNVLVCEQFIDEWLQATAHTSDQSHHASTIGPSLRSVTR